MTRPPDARVGLCCRSGILDGIADMCVCYFPPFLLLPLWSSLEGYGERWGSSPLAARCLRPFAQPVTHVSPPCFGKQHPSTRFSPSWSDSRSRRLLTDAHYASLLFGRVCAAQLGQSCTNSSPLVLLESLTCAASSTSTLLQLTSDA